MITIARMKLRSKSEIAAIALIVLLWGLIVAALVVLDRGHYSWMALLVYACLYVAIAMVENRFGKYSKKR